MLLTRAGLAALAAAALGVAVVPAAGEGATMRVVKRGGGAARHVFWIEPDPQAGSTRALDRVVVGALPPTLAVGDRFDVIDQEGFVGRVIVESIEQAPLGCPGSFYAKGRSRYEQTPKRPAGSPSVAVGPLARPPERARLLQPGDATRDLPPQSSQFLDRQIVDLDGDGGADLVRQYAPCDDQQGRPTAFCFETWGKRQGRWTLLESAKIQTC